MLVTGKLNNLGTMNDPSKEESGISLIEPNLINYEALEPCTILVFRENDFKFSITNQNDGSSPLHLGGRKGSEMRESFMDINPLSQNPNELESDIDVSRIFYEEELILLV